MDRYRVIEKFAKENNWTKGLELGVWVGVTTFWLMKNTKVDMTCIDAWEVQEDNPEYDWQYNKKPVFKDGKLVKLEEFKNDGQVWDHVANEKRFRKEAEQWGQRIKIIKGRSLAVLNQIQDETMDFIFHDSDHSYPFVMNEIKAYWPKLKPGGYAMGDDYNWTPVCKSVKEVFGEKFKVTGKGVWYAVKD
jgi:predicted O-methyltransferase YrrM